MQTSDIDSFINGGTLTGGPKPGSGVAAQTHGSGHVDSQATRIHTGTRNPAERLTCTGWPAGPGAAGHRGAFLAALGVYDLFFGLYLVRGGPLLAPLCCPRTRGAGAGSAPDTAACGAALRRDGLRLARAVFVQTAWALEYPAQFQHHRTSGPGGAAPGAGCVVVAVAAWPET